MSQAVKKAEQRPAMQKSTENIHPTGKSAVSTVGSCKMQDAPRFTSELAKAFAQLEHHDHEAHPDGLANLPQKMILKQLAAAIEPLLAPEPISEPELQAQHPGQFLGLLGRCKIQGCDVHEIDYENDIIRHFKRDASLPSDSWEKARSAMKSLQGDVLGCAVYENDFEIIYRDDV